MITLHKQIQEKTNYNKEQFNTELEIKKHSINYNYKKSLNQTFITRMTINDL